MRTFFIFPLFCKFLPNIVMSQKNLQNLAQTFANIFANINVELQKLVYNLYSPSTLVHLSTGRWFQRKKEIVSTGCRKLGLEVLLTTCEHMASPAEVNSSTESQILLLVMNHLIHRLLKTPDAAQKMKTDERTQKFGCESCGNKTGRRASLVLIINCFITISSKVWEKGNSGK